MKRLLSISHSYVVDVNRALPNAMQQCGDGRWHVTTVAPESFIGKNDLRPLTFEAGDDLAETIAVPARWTSQIHCFTYGNALRRLIREGNYDLVHAWEEPFNFVGFQIASVCQGVTPVVFRTAQSLPKRYPPPFDWIERYCVKRMAGWIFSGHLVEQNLLLRPGYEAKPRCLAPLGYDPELFYPAPEAGAAVRSELGWDDGVPVIGYLGRVVEEKGIRYLMHALDRVTTPWCLLIIGDGTLAPEVSRWAETAAGKVAICDRVAHNEVPRYVNAMDVLAAPSLTTSNWKEQFGRMLVEAFACRVAVIGSDSGEIPHVIDRAGIIVPERDPDALADAISRLLIDAVERSRLAEAGFQRANEMFSWPKIAEHTLKYFDSLID